MENEKFQKYTAKRNELLKKYKNEKIKAIFSTLGIGVAAIAVFWVLYALSIFNVAVTLVLTAVFVMITVIFTRIRVVTINHTRDEKLRLFEDNDPTFY